MGGGLLPPGEACKKSYRHFLKPKSPALNTGRCCLKCSVRKKLRVKSVKESCKIDHNRKFCVIGQNYLALKDLTALQASVSLIGIYLLPIINIYPSHLPTVKPQRGSKSYLSIINNTYIRLRLICDGTRAETRFRLSAKRTGLFKSAGASVQSSTDSRSVRISGSKAGYTKFRGSVKSTGYPLHSPVSPSLPRPCVIVCHYVSTGLYLLVISNQNRGFIHYNPCLFKSITSG